MDPGFRAEGTVSLALHLPTRARTPEQLTALSRQLGEQLSALAGVEAASLASDVPLSGILDATVVGVDREGELERVRVYRHAVDACYLSALRIPLHEGRTFTPADTAEAGPVVLVSRTMAQRFWLGRSALGQRLQVGRQAWAEVVGVVGDVRFGRLGGAPARDPDVYFPLAQRPQRSLALVARSALPPARLLEQVRTAVRETDAGIVVEAGTSLEASLVRQAAPARLNAHLLGAFSLVALALAVLGLHGLVSYVVGQRQREMGIRMALGAMRSDVLRLVLWQGLRPVLAGVAVGGVGALALSRLVASQLEGTGGEEPLVYASLSALLVAIAAGACLLPALRGTRVDPAIALRAE